MSFSDFAGYLLVDAVVPNMWPDTSIEDMVFNQIVFYATNSSAMELSWGDHPPMAHTMFGKINVNIHVPHKMVGSEDKDI